MRALIDWFNGYPSHIRIHQDQLGVFRNPAQIIRDNFITVFSRYFYNKFC
jgi:hypothetical protein